MTNVSKRSGGKWYKMWLKSFIYFRSLFSPLSWLLPAMQRWENTCLCMLAADKFYGNLFVLRLAHICLLSAGGKLFCRIRIIPSASHPPYVNHFSYRRVLAVTLPAQAANKCSSIFHFDVKEMFIYSINKKTWKIDNKQLVVGPEAVELKPIAQKENKLIILEW